MAYCLMSHDILGVCLLVAGGDPSMKLGDVVKQVEEFQEQNGRHFGISSTDFRTLFWRLVWGKFPGSLLQDESESNLDQANLQEVALDVLKYGDAYFNDEGECWDLYENDPKYAPYSYYRCSAEEFYTGQAIRKEMIEFFQGLKGKSCRLRQVQAMLVRLRFSSDILFKCSRPGDNS